MRYLTTVLVLFIAFATAAAQDIIVTESGNSIKAYNIEIGQNAVFYQSSDNADSGIEKISINDVLIIKFENGQKWMPGSQNPQTNSQTTNVDNNAAVDFADADANAKAKGLLSPSNINYIGKKEDKAANEIIVFFTPTANSVLADKNIEFSVVTLMPHTGDGLGKESPLNFSSNNIYVTVKNRSDKTIYLDLGESYLIQNGQSLRYYVPGAVSTTQGTAAGASAAVGIFTLGSTNFASNTTTVINERPLAIPPGVTKVLTGGKFLYFGKIKETHSNVGRKGIYGYNHFILPKEDLLSFGDMSTDLDFSNIMPVKFMTAYSFDDSLTNRVELTAEYVPTFAFGSHLDKHVDLRTPDISDFSEDIFHFLFIPFIQKKD